MSQVVGKEAMEDVRMKCLPLRLRLAKWNSDSADKTRFDIFWLVKTPTAEILVTRSSHWLRWIANPYRWINLDCAESWTAQERIKSTQQVPEKTTTTTTAYRPFLLQFIVILWTIEIVIWCKIKLTLILFNFTFFNYFFRSTKNSIMQHERFVYSS